MGYEMYLVRDDNRTLFELGKTRTGLHVPLQELQDQRSGTFVVGDEDIRTLGEFLIDGILDEGCWRPADPRSMAGQIAWRINRWGGGNPIRVAGEREVTDLTIAKENAYVTTDTYVEEEWLYWDVFRNLDRTLQEQIENIPPPNTLPAVLLVKKFTSGEFLSQKNAHVSRGNPDRSEGAPFMLRVSARELQEEFLDELQQLKPYEMGKHCSFWGCEVNGPHDHGLRDIGPKELRFCGCQCHDGVPIFCSCFGPCCHENHVPRAEQTPRPPIKPSKIGDFKTFVMPVIRTKDGFRKLMP
jgi:hypothetical protein